MPTNWSDEIIVCDLGDEPDLSDELNEIYARVCEIPAGGHSRGVVLDLSGVTYLNSSNIAQMLRLRKALVETSRSLRLCSVADAVWSIMLLTGLDKVFTFMPDKATAIASLQIEDAGKGG